MRLLVLLYRLFSSQQVLQSLTSQVLRGPRPAVGEPRSLGYFPRPAVEEPRFLAEVPRSPVGEPRSLAYFPRPAVGEPQSVDCFPPSRAEQSP